MEYVFSFFIQIVLTVLMTAVFAFVASLIVFVVAYILSSKPKRELNCASAVIAAVVGSVVFGLSLFAINVFVPYYCGVDYGFSDYHKVPLVPGCSLVSAYEEPYAILAGGSPVVDSVTGIAVVGADVVSGTRGDEEEGAFFIYNASSGHTVHCVRNDSIYRLSSIGKMHFEAPQAFYYKNRDQITVRQTDYFGNWAALAAIAIALLVFLVFRFICKRTTLRAESFVETDLLKRYAQIKDKE